MLYKLSGRISQSALRVADKVIAFPVQPCFKRRDVKGRPYGRVEKDLARAKVAELLLVEQDGVLVQACEHHLAVFQKFF